MQGENGDKFILRDHVGLLQSSFQDLLRQMYDLIGKIQRDAIYDGEENPEVNYPLFKYEDIPQEAELIIEKVLQIDALIDEADETTYLGKPEPEILNLLEEQSKEYENDVLALSEECNKGNRWLNQITKMLDVIAENTSWTQTCDDDEDDEDNDSQ